MSKRLYGVSFVLFAILTILLLVSTNVLSTILPKKADAEEVSNRQIVYHFWDDENAPMRHPYHVGGTSGNFRYLKEADSMTVDQCLELIKKWHHEDPTQMIAYAVHADEIVNFSDEEKMVPASCRNEVPALRAEKGHHAYLADDAAWTHAEEMWEKLIENAKATGSITIEDIHSYTSAMYMADIDEDGVPEVIVEPSPGDGGKMLVIKGIWNNEEYVYKIRINCGFQPVDVQTYWHPPVPDEPPTTTATTETTPTTTTVVTTTPYEKDYDEVATEATGGGKVSEYDTGTRPVISDDDPDIYIPEDETKSTTTTKATAKTTTKTTETQAPTSSDKKPETTSGKKPETTAGTTSPGSATYDKVVTEPTEVHTLPPVTEPDNNYIPPDAEGADDPAECHVGRIDE
jgi:hypothetical protein